MLYQGIWGEKKKNTLKPRHTIRHRYQDVPAVGLEFKADRFFLYNLIFLSLISLVIFS
jgi:hypothetical protein